MALSICGFWNLKEALPSILQSMLLRDDDSTHPLNPNVWVISPEEAARVIALPQDKNGKQYTIGDSGAQRSILGQTDQGSDGQTVAETSSNKECVLLQLGRYSTLPDGRVKMLHGPHNSIFLNIFDLKRLIGDLFDRMEMDIEAETGMHKHSNDHHHCSLCNGR